MVTALFLAIVPRGLHAQQATPGGDGRTLTPAQGETIEACYHVPGGVIYRIREPGLPSACVPGSDHVFFSWGSDGGGGLAGPSGPPGPSGPSGPPGPSTGVPGTAGEPGPIGPQGIAGPTGPAGPSGPNGPKGSRESARRVPAVEGTPGERGQQGIQAPRPQGPQGDEDGRVIQVERSAGTGGDQACAGGSGRAGRIAGPQRSAGTPRRVTRATARRSP